MIQLISKGDEDVHLSGDPSITLWKSVYKRHTHFAIESIENKFNPGPLGFLGKTHSLSLEKNADMISRMYLQIELPSLVTSEYINDADTINQLASAASAADAISYDRASTEGFNLTWVNSIGNRILDKVELYIDGHLIDEQYGIWMELWDELTNKENKQMMGKYETDYYSMIQSESDRIIYVPLQLWFCRHTQCALSLVSMYYCDISIRMKFATFTDCVTVRSKLGKNLLCKESEIKDNSAELVYWNTTTSQKGYKMFSSVSTANSALDSSLTENVYAHNSVVSSGQYMIRTDNFETQTCDTSSLQILSSNASEPNSFNAKLYIDYIFLSDEERLLLANKASEILIEQIQSMKIDSLQSDINSINLNFNHQVKELFWVIRRKDDINENGALSILYNDYFNFSGHLSEGEDSNNCISFNNQDCTAPCSSKFFSLIQPYNHHTRIPDKHKIYCYNFGINPQEHQPSGSSNFTNIEEKILRLDVSSDPLDLPDPDFSHNNYADRGTWESVSPGLEVRIFALNYNLVKIKAGTALFEEDQTDHLPDQPVHLPNQSDHFSDQPVQLPDQPVHLPNQSDHFSDQPVQLPDQPVHLPNQSDHFSDQPVQLPDQPVHLPNQSDHFSDQPVQLPDHLPEFPEDLYLSDQSSESEFPDDQISWIPEDNKCENFYLKLRYSNI